MELSNFKLNSINDVLNWGIAWKGLAVVGASIALIDIALRRKLNRIRKVSNDPNLPESLSVSDPIWSFLKRLYIAIVKKENDYYRLVQLMNVAHPVAKTLTGQFFGKTFVSTWNVEICQAIFKDKENIGKLKGFTKMFDDLMGESVVIVEGEKWKHQRQILNPSFSMKYLRHLVGPFTSIADELCSKIEKERIKNGNFDVHLWLSRTTLDGLGKAGFGLDFDSLNDRMTEVYEAYEGILAGFTNPFVLMPFFSKLPLPSNKRFANSKNTFWKWAMKTIDDKRKKIDENLKSDQGNKMKKEKEVGGKGEGEEIEFEISDDVNAPIADLNGADDEQEEGQSMDLLDLMIRATFEEKSLSDEELRQNVFLFFLAGHETTSGTLTFVLDFLARNPLAQSKCRDEILSLFGANSSPSYSSLSKLVYVNQVINESMRLRTPVVQLAREVKNDIHLGGYFFPQGTILSAVISNLHIDKDVWGDDADEFRPERWAERRANGVNFMPFGYGPRMCLGINFANLEMRIILVRLLQQFVFSVYEEVRFIRSITLRPQYGYKLKVDKFVPEEN